MIVAIHGLGLMGASLGAALRRRRAAHVIGIARRLSVARRAVALGAADEATTDLGRIGDADVVVLATPVRVILKTLRPAARLLRPGATLTDVGSTKGQIMKAAAGLPFVGGHPMAGGEKSGVDACDSKLYVGAPYLLVRGRGTRRIDVARVSWIARQIGARPRLLSARAHDAAVAAVSHVPYLIAYALRRSPSRSLAGPSFRDATRVAASDPEMVLNFLLTNRGAIRKAAADFERTFGRLVKLVVRGDERALRGALCRP